MNELSKYIVILCGVFKDNYSPLTRSAFWKLYHKYNDSLESLINSDEEVVKTLLKRSASIAFALEEMSNMGIHIVTFLDEAFPDRVYKKLGDFCPPLFYTCGNSKINKCRFVGYVGSRDAGAADEGWIKNRIEKNVQDNYAIVTGGAKGVDTFALEFCMKQDGYAVLFLPNNIVDKIREAFIRNYIIEDRLLIYSHVSPYAPGGNHAFVSSAMERNKYIYALSTGTVVVKSDNGKGGTWSGAVESLKHKWSHVYVWNNTAYAGNQELIKLGAIPLSDDGSVLKAGEEEKSGIGEQLTIFDFMKLKSEK